MAYPSVTLYIPAYNASRFLKETLPAITSLDYPALKKIYLINDGSIDTAELQTLAEEYNILLIHKSVNEGLGAARNSALQLCETELIVSLDADCRPEKDWLKRLAEKYLETKEQKVAGVGGRLEEQYFQHLPDLFRTCHMVQHHGDSPVFDPEFLAGNNTLFNTEVLKQTGGYPEKGIYRTNHEDFAISLKLKEQGYHLYYEPSAVVYHLRTDSLNSIYRTFWRWYFLFHPEPVSLYAVINKFRRQWVHHVIPWFIEDIRSGRLALAGADLLFPFFQIRYDWQYYQRSRKNEDPFY